MRLVPGTRLVIATHNPGKLAEFAAFLAPYGIEAISAGALGLPEPAETATDFAGNARIKAQAAASAAGLPAMADDSGLSIAGMGNAPGIHSARFARERGGFAQAMADILAQLGANRRALFTSCLCLAVPGNEPIIFAGECHGSIASEPRGAHGFGYDPIFIPDGSTLTFAEMGETAKNAISHRAVSFKLFQAACLDQLR